MWGWLLAGVAALGGIAYVATRGDEEVVQANGKINKNKGAGWYVLRFDRVGEGSSTNAAYDKLPNGRKARLKQYDRYDSKVLAQAAARHARDNEGWSGQDVRVVVEYRGRSPW